MKKYNCPAWANCSGCKNESECRKPYFDSLMQSDKPASEIFNMKSSFDALKDVR